MENGKGPGKHRRRTVLTGAVPVLAAAAVLASGLTARTLAAAPQPAGQTGQAGKAVHRVPTEDRVVFLTVDDGLKRHAGMIDLLRGSGIKATLFLTGQYVRQDSGFFRRMRDRTGAVVENHTVGHPDLAGRPRALQHKEICAASDRFEKVFGRRPTLLRPPYGSFDATTVQVAAECGVKHLVHWSAEIAKGHIEFAAGDRLVPGDIVLMHFRDEFKEDIEAFIDQARKDGLTPALLEDYLK
ncbi:polysaccharide deacetylase family protein [Streptosporangium sp. NPDC000239]|uniref:polysaccharide deacetylase family protein n=1 Tax=Streptosporangium sp. NPDC000239 TaxID=3154248 RepID=UPI00331FA609